MKGRSVRVSGKTLDDAITEALIQLGVTSDKLEYDVIEKGSAGFLGIGMKQAVIEAWRKEEENEEPEEDFKKEIEKEFKKDFKKDFNREFKKENKQDFKKEFKKESKQDFKKDYKKDVRQPKNNQMKENIEVETEKEDISVREEKNESSYVKNENSHERHSNERRTIELAEVTEETIQAVEKFLSDTLNAMGMEVNLESKVESDGSLAIEMKGENMGILIGKRGQTLDSLQYLANRVANKHQSGYVRVKLDTENYRQRREETLKHLAKNIAHKVKRNRRPVALEPMNPYERRIIHSALQSDPYVTTHSEGEEPYRKVVVTLKR